KTPPPPPQKFHSKCCNATYCDISTKKGKPTSEKSPEEVSALCEALRGGRYPALEAEGAARTAFHDSIIDANPIPGDFEAAAAKIASAPSVQAEFEGAAGQALAVDEIAVREVVPGVGGWVRFQWLLQDYRNLDYVSRENFGVVWHLAKPPRIYSNPFTDVASWLYSQIVE
ncbi:MAG: hypothetical protein IJQ73_01375, partial [Kiritimatiellae bacterium]|nr:hypothetical protein [Kiritimatiellia bacterium]